MSTHICNNGVHSLAFSFQLYMGCIAYLFSSYGFLHRWRGRRVQTCWSCLWLSGNTHFIDGVSGVWIWIMDEMRDDGVG